MSNYRPIVGGDAHPLALAWVVSGRRSGVAIAAAQLPAWTPVLQQLFVLSRAAMEWVLLEGVLQRHGEAA